jgi:hypothetical protein
LVDYENDFNEIVKSLFCPKLLKQTGDLLLDKNQKLWEFLDFAKTNRYPVYQKVMMVIEYYNSIDPFFNEQYFRSLEK